jgi:hypothetical protein
MGMSVMPLDESQKGRSVGQTLGDASPVATTDFCV